MSESFLKPAFLRANVKVELDLANYTINATGADTLDFSKTINLANLKSDIDIRY